MSPSDSEGWQRLDEAAFGMIYGSVTVLGLLLAMGAHPGPPFRSAVVLLGTVVAIVLAKGFAEVMSTAVMRQQRIVRADFAAAWRHGQPTLVAANLPTLLFLAAAAGLWSADRAVVLSQIYCTGLLMLVGARVGWVLDGRIVPAVLGAVFAGAVGIALSVLKVLLH